MEEKIALSAETRITDILAAYPWLPDELIRMDERARLMNTFAGRMLIRKSSVADVSRLTGKSVEELLSRLRQTVAAHPEL